MTTNYTWDQTGLGHVVGDGNEYVWGAGLIGRVAAASVTTYAHADGLSSIRLLTDSTGASVGTQAYDAFGATRSQTGATSARAFAGKRRDVNVDVEGTVSAPPLPQSRLGGFHPRHSSISRGTFVASRSTPQTARRCALAQSSTVQL